MKVTGPTKRVLITGATGFIGGRLAEVLVRERGADVIALVRNFSRVARISRHKISLHRSDLLNPKSFSDAFTGVDTVYHCAYEWEGGDQGNQDINITGTLNLAHAAEAAGVRRFVYTSSVAVYGHDLPEIVTEETPYRPTTPYAQIKAEAERRLLAFGRAQGLGVVVIQPSKVFGPYDFGFTVPYIKRLAQGQIWLIENGSGLVNPTYVDNVVQGMLLAAECPGVENRVFILSDGFTLTWAEFADRLSRLCNGGVFGSITRAECESAWKDQSRSPGIRRLFHALFLSQEARQLYPRYGAFRWVRQLLSDSVVRGMKRALRDEANRAPDAVARPSKVPDVPSRNEYRDYMRRGTFSVERAQRELGYAPHVSFAKALDRTRQWLEYARVVNGL